MRFMLVILLLTSTVEPVLADDRKPADRLESMIDDLARIEGAADHCGGVRDRIAELRGRMKALRDDLRGDSDTAPPADGPFSIDDAAFAKLQDRVAKETFADAKLRVIREAASTNYFKAGQVAKLLPIITMNGDRIEALKALAPRILDIENAFVIFKAFDFDSDKRKAAQILKRSH